MRALFLTVAAAAALLPIGGAAPRKVDEGNRLYGEQRWQEAREAYERAQAMVPELGAVSYDVGNAAYRLEDWAAAADAYRAALIEGTPELIADAAHNLGNSLFKNEDYAGAVEAFERSLAARPEDQDTKRNLELALRALEQQQQQPQPDKSKPDEEPSEESQDGEPESQDENKAPEPGEGSESPPPEKPGKEGAPPEEAGQEQRQGGMTAEQALRLLDGLEEREVENLKEKAKRLERARRTAEDW